MSDWINKQDSLVGKIIDGSVMIDSVTKFEDLLKVFPSEPELYKAYANFLRKEKSLDAADAYGKASKFFLESDMTLQAIICKIIEWQIFEPSQQEKQTFFSSLRKGQQKEGAVQGFFNGMTHPELIAFMDKLVPMNFNAGSMVKKFGDEEKALYFVASGALEETNYHRLEPGGRIQKKSTQDLVKNVFFGEIYPFEEEKMSQSDIRTITKVELARISKLNLISVCRKNPNVKLLIENLYKNRSEFVEEKFTRTVRKIARHQLPTLINLKVFQGETGKAPLNVSGFTKDISLGGARVVLGTKYESGHADTLTGKNVKIEVVLPIASDKLSILGTIVWSKEVYLESKKTSEVGIQFKEITDTDRRILEDYHYGSEGEQNLIWSLWDSFMEK